MLSNGLIDANVKIIRVAKKPQGRSQRCPGGEGSCYSVGQMEAPSLKYIGDRTCVTISNIDQVICFGKVTFAEASNILSACPLP